MSDLSVLYPNVNDCFALEKQIQLIKNDINYYRLKFNGGEASARENLLVQKNELFMVLGCPAKIEAKRQADTKAIFDKYADPAKIRIETDSKRTRNVYLVFGGIALTVATFLIIKLSK